MPDITTRADIEQLIIRFYDKVKLDDTIGYIFNDIAKTNWEHHIPVIVDFWEGMLLDTTSYRRNAMDVHYQLHNKEPFRKEFFDRWLQLFRETLDELYEGEKATLAWKRAKGIADLMAFKMLGDGSLRG
ncbi:MAG: group III truncated hemoglobin [Chitinophagaceae bacterium]|nr:group III truncated hemoglobin [Chitinophagaceae bacterium]